jgi:hypothetical protein
MLMIKGEMRLHYRTPESREEVSIIPEGSMIYTPAGTAHSPRFAPDAFALIAERKRRPVRSTNFTGTAGNATRCCTRNNLSSTTTPKTRCRKLTDDSLIAWNLEPASVRRSHAGARSALIVVVTHKTPDRQPFALRIQNDTCAVERDIYIGRRCRI